MTETVLVTGGTGYIAGWCIAELLDRGYRVRTTVRSETKKSGVRTAVGSRAPESSPVAPLAQPDRLSFAVADLTSPAGWDAAVAGVDYVLHVASPLSGDDMLGPARDGTLNVLRAAAAATPTTTSASAPTPTPTSPPAPRQSVVPFTDLVNPKGVAVDKAGDVYVVDFEGGAHTAKAHVEKLAAGSTTPVPFTDLDHPGGVAVDDAGNVYVVDRNHRRVVEMPAGSTTQTVLPFTGLSTPADVAVDQAGTVYVSDQDNRQVVTLTSG